MYCSLNIAKVINSRRLRWADHIPRMEESISAFTILTGKRILGWPKRGWESNIKEIGIYTRDWMDSVRDRDY